MKKPGSKKLIKEQQQREGGFEAEKLQAYREYDFKTVAAYARKVAGV